MALKLRTRARRLGISKRRLRVEKVLLEEQLESELQARKKLEEAALEEDLFLDDVFCYVGPVPQEEPEPDPPHAIEDWGCEPEQALLKFEEDEIEQEADLKSA